MQKQVKQVSRRWMAALQVILSLFPLRLKPMYNPPKKQGLPQTADTALNLPSYLSKRLVPIVDKRAKQLVTIATVNMQVHGQTYDAIINSILGSPKD